MPFEAVTLTWIPTYMQPDWEAIELAYRGGALSRDRSATADLRLSVLLTPRIQPVTVQYQPVPALGAMVQGERTPDLTQHLAQRNSQNHRYRLPGIEYVEVEGLIRFMHHSICAVFRFTGSW